MGPNGRPTTHFADIVALESADAVGVTKGIENGLELQWCQYDDG